MFWSLGRFVAQLGRKTLAIYCNPQACMDIAYILPKMIVFPLDPYFNLIFFTLQEETTPNEKKSWSSRNSNSNINSNNNSTTNGCESPKPVRKQFMTSSEELTNKVNGEVTSLSSDLENLKQEILREVQKELSQMKREIIDGR